MSETIQDREPDTTAPTPFVRRTASTITDPELEALYAQRDLLLLVLAAVTAGAPR